MDFPKEREAEASGFLGVMLLGGAAAHLVGLEAISKRNGPGRDAGAGREETGNHLLVLPSHRRPYPGRPAPASPRTGPQQPLRRTDVGIPRHSLTHTHAHAHAHMHAPPHIQT